MSELKSNEIALKREVFNDELIDALGWLLVIGDEYPEVLRKTCGNLKVEGRLAQMSAILSGRTCDKRYELDYPGTGQDKESSCPDNEISRPARDGKTDDLESWKRALEQEDNTDSHNV